jgi:predicted RND superfamily exporter protein
MEVTGDRATAVRAALVDVGPALLGTTAILTASFAVLGFASVLSIALFGLLSAATLVFALVADLLVLPAMLMVWGPSPRSFTISSSGGSHD